MDKYRILSLLFLLILVIVVVNNVLKIEKYTRCRINLRERTVTIYTDPIVVPFSSIRKIIIGRLLSKDQFPR